MNIFYVDVSNGISKTWEDLINDINHFEAYSPICNSHDPYVIFLHIVISLIIGDEIVLLDSDLSQVEARHLIDVSAITHNSAAVKRSSKIVDMSYLRNCLQNVSPDWSISLYSSGTTGLPKRITHSFSSITRFVKQSNNHSTDIWGFAFNPTHIAGIQVFFQALMNGNTIIRLFGLSREEIFTSISLYSISNISATPTFYRLLLPIKGIFDSVIRLTSGGEKFDNKTISLLMLGFPNAKVTNVYASTEAGTLFASDGHEFSIKESIRNFVKIIDNELVIHCSLMGSSYDFGKDWYFTGDLVEIISENPLVFKFLSRKSDIINVGGYKVNPIEVEEALLEINDVNDVRVYGKFNSLLGNVICCEVVRSNLDLTETIIRHQLLPRLQEFKIPRIINFVDSINTTRTGKKKRN